MNNTPADMQQGFNQGMGMAYGCCMAPFFFAIAGFLFLMALWFLGIAFEKPNPAPPPPPPGASVFGPVRGLKQDRR
jgi:hypothetical protein